MRISDWSSDVCSSDLYVISNAGKLKQRGVEFDAQYDIAPGFEVHGALAYVRNRFHDYIGKCYAYTYAAGTLPADANPPPGCSFLDPGKSLVSQRAIEGTVPARTTDMPALIGVSTAAVSGSK